jgi:hypothetical protein
MSLDDLAKLARNSLLLSLDRIIGPRLIKVVYLLGFAGAILLAIRHFFATFSLGFAEGLWGLLEIAVFGLFGIIALRIICEALIVYFKNSGHEIEIQKVSYDNPNLIDEVRDAIEDLASDDPKPAEPTKIAAKTAPKSAAVKSAPKTRTASTRKAPARAPRKSN